MRKFFALILTLLLILLRLPASAETYPTATPLPGYTLLDSADEVRVFATMSTKANIVGYIIPGGSQEVNVLSVSGDWCYVAFSSIYGTSYGYVPLSCFSVAARPTPTPKPQTTYPAGTSAWIVNYQEGYRLNLRQEPSYTAASQGKYYTGTPVTLTGTIENGFAQVLLAGTALGWVDLNFLTTDALSFAPETPIVTIKNLSGAILRSGPGTNYTRLTRCNYGVPVTVLGICPNGWYHVIVDERIGYMSESVLSGTFAYDYGMDSDIPGRSSANTDRESVFYINTRSKNGVLNLRKSPSSSAKSLGKFYTGTPLTILSYTRTGWAHVRIGQTEGYMDADYLTPTKPTQTGDQRVIRNSRATGLNMRSVPSTGGEIIAFVPNYTYVTVLGEFSDGWCYIEYNNTQGYMLGTYLDQAN